MSIGEIIKHIKWKRIWEVLRLVASFGLATLMAANPAGLVIGGMLISWVWIISLLGIFGIGYTASPTISALVPDKHLFKAMRTGDGTAPVPERLAEELAIKKRIEESIPETRSDAVKVEVTVTEKSVTPPPENPPVPILEKPIDK